VTRRALLVGAPAFAAYIALGLAVRHQPPETLNAFDRLGRDVAGHATGAALVFTMSCWWYVLLSLGACAAVLGTLVPQFRARAIFSIAVTVISWLTSDLFKNAFARERPTYWYVIHEPSYAYSSGHAMFAVIVYGLWGYFFATARLPNAVRVPLATLCFTWAGAVIWSRLALGAHWPTDLAGGVLLGITMLALGAAVAWSWPQRLTART
jgi:undecaprenyl-diphosphatase